MVYRVLGRSRDHHGGSYLRTPVLDPAETVMAESKLNIFNLGSLGVNVDKSPLHLEDGELVQAQNATRDQHGYDGALRKRPGLVKYHSGAAAGSILGFIGAPLGPGPGATTDDAAVYYIGNTSGTWIKSSNSFSTSANVTTIADPADGIPSQMLNNRLFYGAGTTIRVFDGVVDALHSNVGATINWVDSANGTLYVSVTSGGSGFVYEIDAVGRITQIGAALPSSYLAYDLQLHQNDLYASCQKAGSQSKVYRIRLATATSTTAWTLDFTSVENNEAMSLASFKGLLYLATDTAGTTASIVYERSTAGVYTAKDTGGTSSGANSIVSYQGKLYVHWDHFATSDSVIRRSTDGTTWATVATYTPTTAGGVATLYNAGSKIFAIGYQQTKGLYSAAGASWTTFTTVSAQDAAFGFFKASGSGPAFGATSSFVLLQGSSSLQLLNSAGTMNTLTMPTGVTLDTSRPPRFAVFDRYIVMANTPSRPITIDADGLARVLTPLPPVKAISLDDDGGAGGLTGNYLARQTYVIKDTTGNIISESDYSPVMETAFAAAAVTLDAETLNLSPEDITGSKIYRTTTNGTTYFPWIDVDGNTLSQSVSDDTSDAELSLVAAPTLGTAPNLSLVANWRGRLWGVDRADIDFARYSEAGIMYAWPNTNSILIGREGSDARGITAFLARRDALGIGRRDSLHQITGTSATDFRSVVLSENLGVESQESVIVYKDIAYFLAKDGVYKWSAEGIECLSDGKVRSWFNTDTYFNRGRFQYAFASIDPLQNTYRLFLAAAGSSSEDRWVEYNIGTDTWWGPHKTGAFTLSSAGWSTDTNDRLIPLVGSTSGFLWQDQSTRTDNTSTAIDFDVFTKRHSMDTPDIEKYWGQPSLFGIAQSGGTLQITPLLGELNASSDGPFSYSLTLSRQRLRRIGVGKHLQLRLRENTAGQDVILTGYEIPNFEVGRR